MCRLKLFLYTQFTSTKNENEQAMNFFEVEQK